MVDRSLQSLDAIHKVSPNYATARRCASTALTSRAESLHALGRDREATLESPSCCGVRRG